MTNYFYFPKEKEKELQSELKNKQQSRLKHEMYMDIIKMQCIEVKTSQNELFEHVEINFPKIGIFYLQEHHHLFHHLRAAIARKSEEDVSVVFNELLEEIKDRINIYQLYTGMIDYAKTRGANEAISMKWDMQRQFRELIGIEEK